MEALTAPENQAQQARVFSAPTECAWDVNPDGRQAASPSNLTIPSSVFQPVSTLQRSSSLDVHAASPPLVEDRPSGIQPAWDDIRDYSFPNPPAGPNFPRSPHEEWVFLQSYNLQSACQYSDPDTGSNQLAVITPGSPYAVATNSAISSPRISSLQLEGYAVIDKNYSYPQPQTPQVDSSACSRLSSPPVIASNAYWIAESGILPHLARQTVNSHTGRLNLPQSQPSQYPPCWFTDDGLLIVPSIPRPANERSEGTHRCNKSARSWNVKPLRKARFSSSIQGGSIEEDGFPSSPNVTPNLSRCRDSNRLATRRYPRHYGANNVP